MKLSYIISVFDFLIYDILFININKSSISILINLSKNVTLFPIISILLSLFKFFSLLFNFIDCKNIKNSINKYFSFLL